jgi:hypothetical protein
MTNAGDCPWSRALRRSSDTGNFRFAILGPRIGVAVDGQAARPIEARREIGNGLSAYTIAGEAGALAATMRAGRSLLLTLDDRGYSLPLEGLDAALTRLAGVCPHG